jgi:hypothetical protein
MEKNFWNAFERRQYVFFLFLSASFKLDLNHLKLTEGFASLINVSIYWKIEIEISC